ncbi:MAG: hypothetical protein QGI41_11550, partial [Acidimicrobiales bacterium]|nr:hypothetical protein [Acidimicrobiales bacterium]
ACEEYDADLHKRAREDGEGSMLDGRGWATHPGALWPRAADAEEADDGSMMGVLVAGLALSVVLLLVLLTLAVLRLREEAEWDEDEPAVAPEQGQQQ